MAAGRGDLAAAHEHGAMLVLDTVTSLRCIPVEIDKWRVDVAYSCTQKGISAPPGLAPITFSQGARDVIRGRKQKCRSWYFDISMIERYWSANASTITPRRSR